MQWTAMNQNRMVQQGYEEGSSGKEMTGEREGRTRLEQQRRGIDPGDPNKTWIDGNRNGKEVRNR